MRKHKVQINLTLETEGPAALPSSFTAKDLEQAIRCMLASRWVPNPLPIVHTKEFSNGLDMTPATLSDCEVQCEVDANDS